MAEEKAPEEGAPAAPQTETEEASEKVEYFVEDDAQASSPEVVVVMCILDQSGDVLQGKHIWRRLALPADFSLMEAHVALQNAFDWEDTHLHDFTQPVGLELLGGINIPRFAGFGRSDVGQYSRHMVDVHALSPSDVRTFRAVLGVKEDPTDELIVTKAGHNLVYAEHSHPHSEPDPPPEKKSTELHRGPNQVLEERAFQVGQVLTMEMPVLVYEYDFQMGYEVHVFFEGKHEATEGLNYPTCLAGAGASPAEDGDDLDEEGNLKPTYDYDNFAVLDVLANFEKTFEEVWPSGPGAKDKASVSRCYLCRYNRECGRRRECNGKCCDYCLKAPLLSQSGRLALSEAKALYDATAEKIQAARKLFVEEGHCDWLEEDGAPCAVCA